MKKLLIHLFILCGLLVFNAQGQETNFTEVIIPELSPKSSIEQMVGLASFKIGYSRPSKRGRIIFGDLVPFGNLWRTGANARTTLTSNATFSIANKELKAGKYAILTIPNKDKWEVILYTEDGFGNPRTIDESKIALRTIVNTKRVVNTIESFSINFTNLTNNSANLNFEWENTRVTLPISVNTQKATISNINSFLSPNELNYRKIAKYLITEGVELEKSLDVCDKIIELNNGRLSGVWGYHFKAIAYRKLKKLEKKKEQIKLGIKYLQTLELNDSDKEALENILKENKMV